MTHYGSASRYIKAYRLTVLRPVAPKTYYKHSIKVFLWNYWHPLTLGNRYNRPYAQLQRSATWRAPRWLHSSKNETTHPTLGFSKERSLPVKLSKFIVSHMDNILSEWEEFARALHPDTALMSPEQLRDHGKEILEAIAVDIESDETQAEQTKKSRGEVSGVASKNSAAANHGKDRYDTGLSLEQVIAEYRAIRASVLRLWMLEMKQMTQQGSKDMLRFNEAIDEALTESAKTYAESTSRTRDTFLAILGHDLRSPLGTMAMAGDYLTRPSIGTEGTAKIGARVKKSAATMSNMIRDLLGYTRTQLGGKMPISKIFADMKDICESAIDDARALHPEFVFKFTTTGELLDDFDSERLQQVFSNLLSNAAQYGGKGNPITITAQGEKGAVIVQVTNSGPPIPANSLQSIFKPLIQLSLDEQQAGRPSTSMGLGLFIAREITLAHGGTIDVTSSEELGTVFSVCIPRTK